MFLALSLPFVGSRAPHWLRTSSEEFCRIKVGAPVWIALIWLVILLGRVKGETAPSLQGSSFFDAASTLDIKFKSWLDRDHTSCTRHFTRRGHKLGHRVLLVCQSHGVEKTKLFDFDEDALYELNGDTGRRNMCTPIPLSEKNNPLFLTTFCVDGKSKASQLELWMRSLDEKKPRADEKREQLQLFSSPFSPRRQFKMQLEFSFGNNDRLAPQGSLRNALPCTKRFGLWYAAIRQFIVSFGQQVSHVEGETLETHLNISLEGRTYQCSMITTVTRKSVVSNYCEDPTQNRANCPCVPLAARLSCGNGKFVQASFENVKEFNHSVFEHSQLLTGLESVATVVPDQAAGSSLLGTKFFSAPSMMDFKYKSWVDKDYVSCSRACTGRSHKFGHRLYTTCRSRGVQETNLYDFDSDSLYTSNGDSEFTLSKPIPMSKKNDPVFLAAFCVDGSEKISELESWMFSLEENKVLHIEGQERKSEVTVSLGGSPSSCTTTTTVSRRTSLFVYCEDETQSRTDCPVVPNMAWILCEGIGIMRYSFDNYTTEFNQSVFQLPQKLHDVTTTDPKGSHSTVIWLYTVMAMLFLAFIALAVLCFYQRRQLAVGREWYRPLPAQHIHRQQRQ